MSASGLPSLDEIRATRERIAEFGIRTPLLRAEMDDVAGRVWLKCENLQPIGCYKNRPQAAIMTAMVRAEKAAGVYTASSGNAGLGMAYAARRLGIPSRVYTPDNVDAAKVAALQSLGADVRRVSYDEWWAIILNAGVDTDPGVYVDAVRDPRAIAGNGSIGLEILEDLPDVDTIVVPFGGGGLVCGVGAAIRALKTGVRIVAVELETARPLAAARRAGHPVDVPVERSFVQAIGARRVLSPMWPLLQQAVDDVSYATLEETCAGMRTICARARLVAEGAAAVALAAVRAGRVAGNNIACVVSGGNIDAATLTTVLEGSVPAP